MNFIDAILKLIYPDKCMFCNRITGKNDGEFICDDCKSTVEFCKDFKCCTRCGKPHISLGENETCYICLTKTYRSYKRATAAVKYNEKTSAGIKRYKDGNGEIIGEVMAHLMAERVKDVYRGTSFDLIVGVASNDKRTIRRGFDPVSVIAKSLGRELDVPYKEGYLIKIKKTKKQSELDYSHRIRNLIGTIGLKEG
ncbi:MAG: ComF family protein, partial [Clostridia bacterium]|nr:ComF family protein [Clostridia bacterium]